MFFISLVGNILWKYSSVSGVASLTWSVVVDCSNAVNFSAYLDSCGLKISYALVSVMVCS